MHEFEDNAFYSADPVFRESVLETQMQFFEDQRAYPLRGRPFGLAFVWSNAYLDNRGSVGLTIAVNSAAMIAEVFQLLGFEVRIRSNMRKKIFMDELNADMIEELGDVYDCVIVYMSGRGHADAFYAQDGQLITVDEIHLVNSLGYGNMRAKDEIVQNRVAEEI